MWIFCPAATFDFVFSSDTPTPRDTIPALLSSHHTRLSAASACSTMSFSGVVRLNSISDYIAPSNSCVVALQAHAGPVSVSADDSEVRVALREDVSRTR